MTFLELLSPARNLDIGIAAIDSGADAVYIAGPFFGARKDAGNSIEDIATLCTYAHRFGARIFVTVNIVVGEEELPELHRQMLAEQAAGVDAFIVRDERIFGWDDITVPLHASTQCAIRTAEEARRYESLGASRLVLERELSLETVRAIREAVSCELEFFVHGALCVCYSGDCRLSAYLDGRSADRGECIQACRSVYDLVDVGGRVLVKDKALLSLKDFKLYSRLGELASAGVCSFKIEGRLKSASYVRNVTRAYSQALDALVEAHPDLYGRASFGRVSGGFVPDLSKTFNRGYTDLYLDGVRRKGWSSMDAPANLGSFIGVVRSVRRDRSGLEILLQKAADLHNGDGFAFVKGSSIVGFRGDVCEGNSIRCKEVSGLREGVKLYRNIDAAFEKELEKNLPGCPRRQGFGQMEHRHFRRIGRRTQDCERLQGRCGQGGEPPACSGNVPRAAFQAQRPLCLQREAVGCRRAATFERRYAQFDASAGSGRPGCAALRKSPHAQFVPLRNRRPVQHRQDCFRKDAGRAADVRYSFSTTDAVSLLNLTARNAK